MGKVRIQPQPQIVQLPIPREVSKQMLTREAREGIHAAVEAKRKRADEIIAIGEASRKILDEFVAATALKDELLCKETPSGISVQTVRVKYKQVQDAASLLDQDLDTIDEVRKAFKAQGKNNFKDVVVFLNEKDKNFLNAFEEKISNLHVQVKQLRDMFNEVLPNYRETVKACLSSASIAKFESRWEQLDRDIVQCKSKCLTEKEVKALPPEKSCCKIIKTEKNLTNSILGFEKEMQSTLDEVDNNLDMAKQIYAVCLASVSVSKGPTTFGGGDNNTKSEQQQKSQRPPSPRI